MDKEQALPAKPLPRDVLNVVLTDFYQNGATIIRKVPMNVCCVFLENTRKWLMVDIRCRWRRI